MSHACLELKKNNSPFFHYRIKFLSMNKWFSIVKNIQGGGGEGWLSTPSEVFLSLLFFSKRIKHQHLTLSVTVPLSLAHFKTSSVMFSFYGYEASSKWSNHFWVKILFFQLLSKIKVNLQAKIMKSAPLLPRWGYEFVCT